MAGLTQLTGEGPVMRTFLEFGLANAVMATVLAVLAAGIGLFCRRPAVRHTLWLLVLLKLVTPPVFSVPVCCPNALPTLFPKPEAVRSPHEPLGSESADVRQTVVDRPGNQEEANEIFDTADASLPAPEALPFPAENAQERPIAAPVVEDVVVPNFSALVFAVWFTGAVVWFTVAGTRIGRFQRLLRYGRIAPDPLQEQARLLAARLDLARCPVVWLVPGRVSPLLWMLGRRLYLIVPEELLERLAPEQHAGLLAHELAHARRRDHWVRWLEFLVSGLYWWLPVVWWARRQLQQAEEECCDAWVVWTLPTAAKAYAKALLQTVEFLDARPVLPPVASGIGHVHHLKRRLSMIVRQPFSPQLPWPVYFGIIVLGALVLPLAPQRLVAQDPEAKPAPQGIDNAVLVRAEQDPSDRDVERRLRALEERMDRLMQKLDAKAEAGKEKARAAAAEQKAKAKEQAEMAKKKAKMATDKARAAAAEPKAKASQFNDFFNEQRAKAEKAMSPEQIEKLKQTIHERVNKALNPERMKELQRRIDEIVDQNLNPERMQAIQKNIDEVLKRSTQQLNEALKRSSEDLGRAQKRLREAEINREKAQNRQREAERSRASAPKSERLGIQEPQDLERRMDRLEKKMDRVLQALEKSGKSF
jgi:bla regulator protein BlaR1